MDQPTAKKERASNFELLKIVSMFFVVSLHVCTQSGIMDAPASMVDDIVFTVLSEFGRTACTVFVMVSAWFLCDAGFKFERILRVWLTTLIYVLIIYFFVYHSYEMPWYDFFPVGGGILWFVSAYICMLLVSPVLNAVLHYCPQKYLGTAVLLTGIPLMVYATVSLTDGMLGNNVVWFSWLYLFVGYVKKYPVKLFENRLYMLILLAVLCFIRLFPRVEVRWSGRIPFMEGMLPYLDWWRDVLWTLPSFLTAAAVFFIFAKTEMKSSRVINFFGAHTLAIYILHQMPFFYGYLWNGIYHCQAKAGTSMEIPYLLYVIISIFIRATLIDLIFEMFLFKPVFSRLKPKLQTIDGLLNFNDKDCEQT